MSNPFNILLHENIGLFAGLPMIGNSDRIVRAGRWFMNIVRMSDSYYEVRVA